MVKNKTRKKRKIKTIKSKMRTLKSYSPTINKQFKSLKSNIKLQQLTTKCQKKKQIYIHDKEKCFDWNDNMVKQFYSKNLQAKNINEKKILAPKQYQSNCWFNTFFMVFFISDKGRKFTRHFRETMITGKRMDGSKLDSNVLWPFFELNTMIHSSLEGHYGGIMNTNNSIMNLYKILIQHFNNLPFHLKKKYYLQHLKPKKVNDAGNPLSIYEYLMIYLGKNPIQLTHINVGVINNKKKVFKILKNEPHIPHIISVERFGDDKIDLKNEYKFGNYKYKLDSVVLRDISKEHFSAYLTVNKKEFRFDGESFKRLNKFKWKKNINNANKTWQNTDEWDTPFNFTKGYGIYFYYRT